MLKFSPLILALLFFFSCVESEEHLAASQESPATTARISPPQVTVLADLPDSLQPQTIALQERPPARTIAVPTKKGGMYTNGNFEAELSPPVRQMLPVLKNKAGQIVLDQDGRSFLLGNGGGISHFTNYTAKDGLALDALTCSYLDRSGHLWLGTRGQELSRFNGTDFTTYTTEHGLSGNTIRSITQDRAGSTSPPIQQI